MCTLFTQPERTVRDRAKIFAEELFKITNKEGKLEELLDDQSPIFIDFPFPEEYLTEEAQEMRNRLLQRVQNPYTIPVAPDLTSPIVLQRNVVSIKMATNAWWSTVLAATKVGS
jgi:hypothetical protein